MFEHGRAFVWNRALAAIAILLFVALATGCSEEGRLIDTALPVNGVAWDLTFVKDTTIATSVIRTVNVRFKISLHAATACEAQRGLLELRSTGPTSDPTFIIRPVARYNLDDPCTVMPGGPSDTVYTLTVTGLQMTDNQVRPFRVETTDGPEFVVGIDSTMHPATPSTIRFEVHVESRSAGTAIAGAGVLIEQLGPTPGTLGSGTSDVSGFYALDVASAAAAGLETIPYRVTVTNGLETQVISVPSFPARGQSRERVVVRI